MERPIGEKFEYKGHKLEVFENRFCSGCFFEKIDCSKIQENGECSFYFREDHKSVIFKEIKQ